MNLSRVLEFFNIKNAPHDWERNWNDAYDAYNGVPFIEDAYIKETNKLLRLSDERVRLICETAAFFRASPEGQHFIWLWYYIVSSISNKYDGVERDDAFDNLELGEWPIPAALPAHLKGMPHVLALLGFIPALQSFYVKRGIPHEFLLDTLQDFNVSMNAYAVSDGYCGIGGSYMRWQLNHLTGRLFGLGRLQFIHKPYSGPSRVAYYNGKYEMLSPDAPLPIESCPSLTPGDSLLDVHIPRQGPLEYEACVESYRQALGFFKKYFPELDIKGFMCGSWLLSPKLKEILPPEANIYRFNDDYFIYKIGVGNSALYTYVFRVKEGEELPEKTSLQRALKKHLADGGYVGSGTGVILSPAIMK